jgi:ABC-type multidrug transport system fused ATPase/permease subunit
MLLSSIAEAFSIGAVIPFLSVLTSSSEFFTNNSKWLPNFFLTLDQNEKLLVVTIFFIGAALVALSFRLVLMWATTKYSYMVGADISSEMYKRSLYQPYLIHVSRNSSEVVNAITLKAKNVIHVIMMAMTFVSSMIFLIVILLGLLILSPNYTLTILVIFSLIYFAIAWSVRLMLVDNSRKIAKSSDNLIRIIQEGLGGIRDILLGGYQEVFSKLYTHEDLFLRKANAINFFIVSSPRYVVETLGMVIIAVFGFLLVRDPDPGIQPLEVLGVLVLCAQRTLPLIQQIYTSVTSIQGQTASVNDVILLLDQPILSPLGKVEKISFKKNIRLQNVRFKYNLSQSNVVNNVSLKIKKGECVGFYGQTGSGKSTLLDIIMGLLSPTEGKLDVDGKLLDTKNCSDWQLKISHVPQFIYLTDASIAENIAFGIPKNDIDFDRVKLSAKQAQLDELIESWSMKYDSKVGENGVRLSGGQRQRIGIARALYNRGELLVLDEATSALDIQTEHGVIDSIQNLDENLTIIIVAHRLSTLSICDKVFEFENGGIKKAGSYNDLLLKGLGN